MKKRKKLPLMVVATVEPAGVASIPLKLFQTDAGDFMTTASLAHVFSPYNGEEIASEDGVDVEDTIDEDEAIGVVCTACNTINATMDHGRHEMNCVACGTHLAFDPDSEGLSEDELSDEDAGFDPSVFDPDEEAGDDQEDLGGELTDSDDDELEDTAESEMVVEEDDDDDEDDDDKDSDDTAESEVEDSDDNDESDEQIDLTDVADSMEDGVEPDIIELEESVVAVAAGMIVAHMSKTHTNAAKATTDVFIDGIRQVAKVHGLGEALKSAGFKPVTINASKAVASKLKSADRSVKAAVEEDKAKQFSQIKRCMDIAAAGALSGLFKKENASVLFDELTTVLASLNVVKPRSIARRVLAKALPKHNAAILQTAQTLMGKQEPVLSAFEEQIKASDETIFEDTDLEEDDVAEESGAEQATMKTRLDNPLQQVETSNVKKFQPKDSPRYAGLFKR